MPVGLLRDESCFSARLEASCEFSLPPFSSGGGRQDLWRREVTWWTGGAGLAGILLDSWGMSPAFQLRGDGSLTGLTTTGFLGLLLSCPGPGTRLTHRPDCEADGGHTRARWQKHPRHRLG